MWGTLPIQALSSQGTLPFQAFSPLKYWFILLFWAICPLEQFALKHILLDMIVGPLEISIFGAFIQWGSLILSNCWQLVWSIFSLLILAVEMNIFLVQILRSVYPDLPFSTYLNNHWSTLVLYTAMQTKYVLSWLINVNQIIVLYWKLCQAFVM